MKNVSRSFLLTLTLLALGAVPSFAGEPDSSANRSAQPGTIVAPAYPYIMRHAEAAAEVTVAFTVDTEGRVTKPQIAHSSNFEFNAAALAAVKKWTFAPALKNGQAVETKLQQKFVFSVQNQMEINSRTLLTADKGSR